MYIIVVTALFIYYLFPSDAVKRYIAFNLNHANPELSITIGNIKPVFPPGLRLYNVSLYHLNQLLLEAKQIKITPGLLSLFGAKTTNSSESTGTLIADINISDCKVELLLPVFNLKSVAFTDIKTKAVITNKKIQINECIINGNQADGRISGSVNLKNPLGQSVLNLTGNIKPHHLLVENLQNIFPLKSLLKSGEGSLPVRLYGTIDQPCFSLK